MCGVAEVDGGVVDVEFHRGGVGGVGFAVVYGAWNPEFAAEESLGGPSGCDGDEVFVLGKFGRSSGFL